MEPSRWLAGRLASRRKSVSMNRNHWAEYPDSFGGSGGCQDVANCLPYKFRFTLVVEGENELPWSIWCMFPCMSSSPSSGNRCVPSSGKRSACRVRQTSELTKPCQYLDPRRVWSSTVNSHHQMRRVGGGRYL
eukprot:1176158-Prorocentrum_minimum.AAC.2